MTGRQTGIEEWPSQPSFLVHGLRAESGRKEPVHEERQAALPVPVRRVAQGGPKLGGSVRIATCTSIPPGWKAEDAISSSYLIIREKEGSYFGFDLWYGGLGGGVAHMASDVPGGHARYDGWTVLNEVVLDA